MIDYFKIAQSIKYYEKKGFVRIEAPWWVSRDISQITKPKGVEDFYIEKNKKVLVASGEQSFLYMANKGRLPKGQYQTVTPCFRDESIDREHKKCFIKNELIKTDSVRKKDLNKIVKLSYNFFKKYVPKKNLIIEKTNIGYDINMIIGEETSIELGSYGIRECEFLEWIYATGCAEPRLSRALDRFYRYKKSLKYK